MLTRRSPFLVLVLAGTLQAHQAVEVAVKDPNGKPIKGCSVQVTGPALAKPAQGTTDDLGRCQLDLPVGTYQLRLIHQGFLALARTIKVGLGAPHHLAFTLHPYAATVEVSAQATVANLSQLDEPLNHLLGIADAANEGIVTPAELQARAYQRPGDLLETVPGLLISQHSGEGKANQYYLRGFNLDHGTDVAIRVAGMPVNLPTHAHGQGYLDLNFLIPELVSRVQYRKGPTFAEEGDFSAAGSVDIGYLHAMEQPLLTLEGGAYSYRRALFTGSWKVGGGDLLVAQEGVHNDGPWEHPEDFRKFSTVVRWSRGDASQRFSVTAMAYGATWDATDQIPQRAVEAGQLGWFGTLDPTNGGQSHRASLSLEFQKQQGETRDRIEAYLIGTRLELTSNFTGWLDDPVNGDQFQQAERRTYGGLHANRAMGFRLFDRPAELQAGLQARWDNIPTVGLFHTLQRQRLHTIREDQVLESSIGAYLQAKIQPLDYLRATLGLRQDRYGFDVQSSLPANSGSTSASITSPKLSLAFGPWAETEFYVAKGRSFHSNDARGTTLKVDPQTGDPATSVTPLVRALGQEVGVRSSAVPRWQWTLSLWRLDLDSELVFSGDAGITEPSRPSRREGVEWANTVQITPWASLDLDLAWSKARFTTFDPVGDRIPGAVEGVGSLSLDLHPAKGWQTTFGFRYFGARPLIEDNTVRSKSSLLAQAKVSWEPNTRWRINLEGFNLANRKAADIDYYYRSRLPGEPAAGVDDIHFHPVEPRNLRLGIACRF